MFSSDLRTPPLEGSEFVDIKGDGYFSRPKLIDLHSISTTASDCTSSSGSSFRSCDGSEDERDEVQLISPLADNDDVKVSRIQYRFLLVDDNMINLKILRRILRKLYPFSEIDTLLDSRLAEEKIICNGYDVVFLDIEMPHVDGIELARLVRLKVEYDRLGLIAVTTKYKESNLETYRKEGFDFTFAKPLSYPYNYISSNIDMVISSRSCT